MLQRKIDEIFKDLPNEFGIADDILVVEYDVDGKDPDDTLQRVLQLWRQVNLKLNKHKCHIRCTSVLFFSEVISKLGAKPDPWKLMALTEMPPPKSHIQAWCETRPMEATLKTTKKKKLQALLGMVNYLSKFSPSTMDVCEWLGQLTSSKTEWTWIQTYQKLFDKAKSIITEDTCMEFYDETQLLYLEIDTCGIEIGAALLQTRSGMSSQRDKAPDNNILRPIVFASNRL